MHFRVNEYFRACDEHKVNAREKGKRKGEFFRGKVVVGCSPG